MTLNLKESMFLLKCGSSVCNIYIYMFIYLIDTEFLTKCFCIVNINNMCRLYNGKWRACINSAQSVKLTITDAILLSEEKLLQI